MRRAASAAIQTKNVTIAIRNGALAQGKIRSTSRSALAASETIPIGRQLGSPRTASAIASGASAPVATINRNAISWIQPCQVVGFPPPSIGVSTRKATNISATPSRPSSMTAKLLARLRGSRSPTAMARITISKPVITKVTTCAQPYGPRANELGHGTCSPPTNSQPSRWR